MGSEHRYETRTTWVGNRGEGTANYRSYDRASELSADGPGVIDGSSDPAFRGDATRWNPEQLLVASLSQCHMLWYLHLCAVGAVVVADYVDDATGTMAESADGGGQFTQVVLRPVVTVTDASMIDDALALHTKASELCFIARSVNFPVRHEPQVRVAGA
jgi:organic hydroperoxide reductase OsmC/OhrA